MGQMAVLAVAVGIFVGTLSLGRTQAQQPEAKNVAGQIDKA
ncbi:MAG TPA: hypothetical protein VIF62_25110 [Labilithrix sp.]